MNSYPKYDYTGHYTKSGNLMVSQPGFKNFRVNSTVVDAYIAYLIRMGHTFTLISKK